MTGPVLRALPVAWWPVVLPPSAGGLHVIGLRTTGDRESARKRIRAALREAIARLYGLDAGEVMIHFSPGVSPAVSFSRAEGPAAPGISISHDGELSVAAINLHGAVGIDVMAVQDIEDWRELARDYLGPQTLAELASLPDAQRPAALALAWTSREARLKCHGRQLTEWDGAEPPAQCLSLVLPAPFVGTIAIPLAAR